MSSAAYHASPINQQKPAHLFLSVALTSVCFLRYGEDDPPLQHIQPERIVDDCALLHLCSRYIWPGTDKLYRLIQNPSLQITAFPPGRNN